MSNKEKSTIQRLSTISLINTMSQSPPGKEARSNRGVTITRIEYYENFLREIMKWSPLSLDEIEQEIDKTPETIGNSAKPSYKSDLKEALKNIMEYS